MKIQIKITCLWFLCVCLLVSCSESVNEEPEIVEDTTPVLDEYIFRGIEANKTITLPGKHLDKLVWTSDNPFCAIVEGTKLKLKHIGFTNIYTSGRSSTSFMLWVLVTPKFTDYDLPYVCEPSGLYALDYNWPCDGAPLWGTSVAAISSLEKAREKDRRSTNSLQVYKTGNNRSPYVCYFFEGGKLAQAGTIISLTDLKNLPDFLNERYLVTSVDIQNYSAYFVHARGSKEVIDYCGGMQYFSQLGGVLLVLLPYSDTKSVVNIAPLAEELTEFFKKEE